MNDEQLFLANAYVDGELTADERVIAEADPEVMAEVDELRALISELRDVEPPSTEARESAIAAAMAEFGSPGLTAPTPATAPAPPEMAPVIPLHRRSWFRPTLSVAAAAVGIGLLAVVVTQAGGGSDDDDAADMAIEPAAEPAEEPADQPAEEPASEDFVTSGAMDDMMDEPAEEAAVEAAADESDEAAADDFGDAADTALPTTGDEPAEEPADEPADAERSLSLDELPGGSPEMPLFDEFELGLYAEAAIAHRDARTLPPDPNHSCPIEFIVANGYLGTADGVVREFLLQLAPDDSAATALSLDDDEPPCTPLLTTPLPFPDG